MPISLASLIIVLAVKMLREPGSTVMSILSIERAVALPRCSIPASMSTMTTSSLLRIISDKRLLRRTFSGQAHPSPPFWAPPMTSSFIPWKSMPYLSAISLTVGLSLNSWPNCLSFAPVLSSISWRRLEMGVIEDACSGRIPMAEAKLASGSASTAKTWYPSLLKKWAKMPAMVVLPVPPFPVTANFMVLSLQK